MRKEALQKRISLFLCHGASALLLVAAFPPWSHSAFIFVALVPWLYQVSRLNRPRSLIMSGFFLGFFASLGWFFWIPSAAISCVGFTKYQGVLLLAIQAAVSQAHFIPFAILCRIFLKDPADLKENRCLFVSASMALSFVGLETFSLKIFDDTLGHALADAAYLRQAADLGGASLLTFLIVFVNILSTVVLKTALRHSTEKRSRRIAAYVLTIAALFVFWFGYGIFRIRTIERSLSASGTAVRIAGIVPHVSPRMLSKEAILFQYRMGSMDASHWKPDLIVWPEGAYPYMATSDPRKKISVPPELRRLADQTRASLLYGSRALREKVYNSAYVLTPSSSFAQSYDKHLLFPLSEGGGSGWKKTAVRLLFSQAKDFGRGAGPMVFEIPIPTRQESLRLLPLICYEAIRSDYVRLGMSFHPDILINIVDDSWFSSYGEPQLHMALSRFRSIETRRPMVRVANGGDSVSISATGEILSHLDSKERGVLYATVICQKLPLTPFQRGGYWFQTAALLLGGAGLAALRTRKRLPVNA